MIARRDFHQGSIDDGGDGSHFRRCHSIGRRPAGPQFDRHRAAQAQGAAERRRLPHAHLRSRRAFRCRPIRARRRRNAAVPQYRLLQQRIGTTRVVVVQPRNYATDNRVTLDALAQLAPNARGVAVVTPAITDAELKAFHAGGIRGIRFSLADAVLAGGDARHGRAAVEARCRSRLARAVQRRWRDDRRDGEHPAPAAVRDGVRSSGASAAAGRDRAFLAQDRARTDRQGPHLGQALGRLFEQQDRPAVVSGGDQDRAGLRQGGAGAPRLGQRLAASRSAQRQTSQTMRCCSIC